MFKILLTLLFSFYTTISFSHSQLTDILPKNNIVYTKTPSKIELTFRSKVKLIKIDLNKTSAEKSKIKMSSLLMHFHFSCNAIFFKPVGNCMYLSPIL